MARCMWWWLLTSTAGAEELSGYSELRLDYTHGVSGAPWALHERVRPTLEAAPSDWLRVVATVEGRLDQGRYAEQEAVELLEEQLPGVLLDSCPLPEPGARVQDISDVLSVARLFVDVYAPRFDLRIGRQALNWGSAMLLNPTDLFAEVLVAEPWRERQGVNGARATIPLGQRHQLVAVAAVSDPTAGGWQDVQGRFGLKPTFNVASTDIAPVLAATTDGEPFVGLDVRGQLGVGWWLEGGIHLDGLLAGELPAPEVSVGVDYSLVLLQGLLLAAQYTYDGTGLADPADYTLAARGGGLPLPDCALAQDAVGGAGAERFTIGRHYGLASARLSFLDDYQLGLTALMNLQDRSTLLVPTGSWTPGGAWSVSLSGQVMLGQGELNPRDTTALHNLVVQPDPDQAVTRVYVDLQDLLPAWAASAYVRYAF